MIGPVLVHIERNDIVDVNTLYYLYKTDTSQGIAEKYYIDVEAKESTKQKVYDGSFYESWSDVLDFVTVLNKDAKDSKIRNIYTDYEPYLIVTHSIVVSIAIEKLLTI